MERMDKANRGFSPHLWGAHRYTTYGGTVRPSETLAEGCATEPVAHGGLTFPQRGQKQPTSPLCTLRAEKGKKLPFPAHKVCVCFSKFYLRNVGGCYGECDETGKYTFFHCETK